MVFSVASCDYIYLNGLRFASGAASVSVTVGKDTVKLAVVRNGKGASRLERWAPNGRADGCVGEISLRDLEAILASEGRTEVSATVHLRNCVAEVSLDPSKAMGRQGREIDQDVLEDLLSKASPEIAREIAITQLHTLPYGIKNHQATTRRLSLLSKFLSDGDIRQAVLDGAEYVPDHALPRFLEEIASKSPQDFKWLQGERDKRSAAASTGVLGDQEQEIALCSKAAAFRASVDEAKKAASSEFVTDAQLIDIIDHYDLTSVLTPAVSDDVLLAVLDRKHVQCSLSDWDGYHLPDRQNFETYLQAAVSLVSKDPSNLESLFRGSEDRVGLFSPGHPGEVALVAAGRGGSYPDFARRVFDAAVSVEGGIDVVRSIMSSVSPQQTHGLNSGSLRSAVWSYGDHVKAWSRTASEQEALAVVSAGSIPEIESLLAVSRISSVEELERVLLDKRPSVQVASLLRLDDLGSPGLAQAFDLVRSSQVSPTLVFEVLRRSKDPRAAVDYLTGELWSNWDSGTCFGMTPSGVDVSLAVLDSFSSFIEPDPLPAVVKMALDVSKDKKLFKAVVKAATRAHWSLNSAGLGHRIAGVIEREMYSREN